MCEEISSHISSLQVEHDEARLLRVGVRPSSSLQQAPWWVKIPKRFTRFNLPHGVTDDQRDKDLARMGVTYQHDFPNPISIRTPSPDIVPRKRRKRHSDFEERKRSRRESYTPAEYDDLEDWYPHLSDVPSSVPQRFQKIQIQNDTGPMGSLTELLQVVEDDMRMQLEPPPSSSTILSQSSGTVPSYAVSFRRTRTRIPGSFASEADYDARGSVDLE